VHCRRVLSFEERCFRLDRMASVFLCHEPVSCAVGSSAVTFTILP
jgi:hypothetical protein